MQWTQRNLGRFRLAVSGDPAAFEREQKRFAVVKVSDPWLRLAAAYAMNSRIEVALPDSSRALQHADGYEAKKPILELAAEFDDLLFALVQRQPDDPHCSWLWPGNLPARGQQRLAEKRLAEAQTELEKCREIYTRLHSRLPAHNRAALRMDLTENDVAELSVALAKAYHVLGDQPADSLLKAHPAAVAGIGDLYAVDKKWDRAVAEYTKAITPETTFAKLLAKRARSVREAQAMDLAVADWTRASQQQPDVAFERFKPAAAGSWRFLTRNGGAGSMEVVDGTLVFTTTVVTGTTWDVQFTQGRLQLENGAEYVIRFKMKSPDSMPAVILVGAINQEDYHLIGLNETFVPPSEFKDYEFTFVPYDVVREITGLDSTWGTNRGKVMVKEIVIPRNSRGTSRSSAQGLRAEKTGHSGTNGSSRPGVCESTR